MNDPSLLLIFFVVYFGRVVDITAFHASENTFVQGMIFSVPSFGGLYVARHVGWERFVARGSTISRLIVMLRDFCAAGSILLRIGFSGPSTI